MTKTPRFLVLVTLMTITIGLWLDPAWAGKLQDAIAAALGELAPVRKGSVPDTPANRM